MIIRAEYLEQLKQWKDEPIIKCISGLRHCGKSTLLMQYKDYLRSTGVEENQIVTVDLENPENRDLLDYRKLYAYLKKRLIDGKVTYIFLDEVGQVPFFEKAVNSLYQKPDVDLYLTTSDHSRTGDPVILFTARCIEIKMLPFSLKEFLEVTGMGKHQEVSEYIKTGGLPVPTEIYRADETPDLLFLKEIAKYLSGKIGSSVSIRSVTAYLKETGIRVSPSRVKACLKQLTDSFVFYPVEYCNVITKELLPYKRNYYPVDLGIRNRLLTHQDNDLDPTLETMVYFELLRRGYQAWIGKCGRIGIDFVVRKGDIYTYYQVTPDMTAEETFERKMRPLQRIPDNYEKIILTADLLTPGNYNGIQVVNLFDWLLDTKESPVTASV